ncbi:MAG: DoxX family protein [Cardiobacterium sp.]
MRFLAPYQGIILSFVRIASAYMFILHGTTKAFGFPSAPQYPLEWMSIFGAAAALELVGGTLLLLGLFTRPVAFILSGQMAVAYFMVHAKSALFFPLVNHGESAALFSLIFLYFAAAGGGSLSLDRAISRYDD